MKIQLPNTTKPYTYLFILSFIFSTSCNTEQQVPSKSLNQITPAKDSILVNLKSTNRISSNHYSDLVMDNAGNSYLACFLKKADNYDYILILKVNPNGNIEWELGTETQGRATAISINSINQIFVTGYFKGKLQLGNKRVESENSTLFIAELEADGNCNNFIIGEGGAIAFDISVNQNGALLIAGHTNGLLSLAGAKFKNETSNSVGFLAFINEMGVCEWIKEFDAVVARIKSQENDFFITGRFSEDLKFEKYHLQTTEDYDKDGFVMGIQSDGRAKWLNQFGTKGIIQYGYQTYEGGNDIAFDKSGNVVIASLINHTKKLKQSDYTLLKYNLDGKLLDETIIINEGNVSTLTFLNDQNYNFWLTGSSDSSLLINDKEIPTQQRPNTFILKLDQDFKFKDIILLSHDENMLFRSSSSNNRKVTFSGHYTNKLSIRNEHIQTSAKHELFLYSIPY